ncbi:hypothetical protein G6F22_021598 [Rhizopus arrhizus]|nr:hypothetical protein G6F22_021598 [Rhizopus arrhizus]
MRLAQLAEHPRIACLAVLRVESPFPLMFYQHERGQGFEHRHFDALPFTGAQLVEQRGQDAVGDGQARNFVTDDGRRETGFARQMSIDRAQAGNTLDHIVAPQ